MLYGVVRHFTDEELRDIVSVLIRCYKGYEVIDIRTVLPEPNGSMRLKVGNMIKIAGFKYGDYLKAEIKGDTIIFTKVKDESEKWGAYKVGKSGKFYLLKPTRLLKALGIKPYDKVIIMVKQGEIAVKPLKNELAKNKLMLEKVVKILKKKAVSYYVVSDEKKDVHVFKMDNGKEIKLEVPKKDEVVIDARDVDKVFDYIRQDIEDI